jgi:hypothetical protein
VSKRRIEAGATDQTIDVFIQDSSSTTGAGLTGLVFNTASLTCYYRKGATGTPTTLTLATQTVGGAHTDGGFVAVDGTNCPGQYRLDLSDTIVATAPYATLYLRGAANMVPCVVEIEVGNAPSNALQIGGQTASASGTITFPNATLASTTNITAGTLTTVTNLTNLPTIPSNWLTAAGIAASALDDKGNWLKPTVAGRTLDVTATGAAGIDWGNVEDQGALVDLAQTSVFQVTDANVSAIDNGVISASKFAAGALDAVWSTAARTLTAATNITSTGGSIPITAGGLVSGDVTAISTDTTAADNLERWFDGTVGFGTSGSVITGSLSGAVGSITGVTFPTNFGTLVITASGVINANLEEIKEASLTQSGLGQLATSFSHMFNTNTPILTVESFNQTGDSFSRLGLNGAGLTALGDTRIANLDAAVSSRMATYTQPSGFLAATFPSTVASPTNITAATGAVLSTAGANAVADTTLRRTMANVEASASGDTLALSSIYGFVQMAQESAVSGTTLTVKKTDGTTTLGTKTVTTDAGADPITGVS